MYLATGDYAPNRDGGNWLLREVWPKVLKRDPHDGALFVFRGKRGDLVKAIWWDGQGMCLFAKRLERGRFVWPVAKDGSVKLSAAELSMLLEGIDWRNVERTWRPEAAA